MRSDETRPVAMVTGCHVWIDVVTVQLVRECVVCEI